MGDDPGVVYVAAKLEAVHVVDSEAEHKPVSIQNERRNTADASR